MDNLKFIDTETWEIVNEPENLIHVDKDIAEAVALLNKKGYKTKASCSGHPRYELTSWFDKKENLNEYPIAVGVEESKNNNEVNFYVLQEGNSTYVSFSNIYEFDTLPDGFKYELHDDYCVIRKIIKVLDDNKEIYNKEELIQQLNKTYNDLLEWVKCLEINKENFYSNTRTK